MTTDEPSDASARVDVRVVLDASHGGVLRAGLVGLCALVALLDGFDLQIIGLAAPSLARELVLSPTRLGAVISAALAGLALGGLVVAPAADRVGRKAVLVGASVCFAVFTLATTVAHGMPMLLAARLLTGLGLGAALPSAVSLASEYVPARLRATTAGIMFAGLPVGGVLAGLLGSALLPSTGWRGLFVLGGTVPLVVAALVAVLLPESAPSLVARGAPSARIARSLRRVAPDVPVPAAARFVVGEPPAPGVPVRHLFSEARARPTLLLWAASFAAFGVLVVNSSWTPTLLATLGVPVVRAAVSLATFNAGSVVATAAGGWLLQRCGARAVIVPALVLAALAVLGIGLVAPSTALVTAMELLVGLGLGAASSGVVAAAAVAYPAAIRSTGVGAALGIGRVGSFVLPLVVGALVAATWAVPAVFGTLGAVCLLGAVAAVALRPAPAGSTRPAPVDERTA